MFTSTEAITAFLCNDLPQFPMKHADISWWYRPLHSPGSGYSKPLSWRAASASANTSSVGLRIKTQKILTTFSSTDVEKVWTFPPHLCSRNVQGSANIKRIELIITSFQSRSCDLQMNKKLFFVFIWTNFMPAVVLVLCFLFNEQIYA